MSHEKFETCLRDLPLIAILRGIQPEEAVETGRVLWAAGFRIIEVPLNSPSPLLSIQRLRASLPAACLVGAGTVTSPEWVQQVAAADPIRKL